MQKKFEHKYINDKNYRKFKDHYYYAVKYRGAAHSICHWNYSIREEIPAIFDNGSNNAYHCIIKLLEKKFEGELID